MIGGQEWVLIWTNDGKPYFANVRTAKKLEESKDFNTGTTIDLQSRIHGGEKMKRIIFSSARFVVSGYVLERKKGRVVWKLQIKHIETIRILIFNPAYSEIRNITHPH